MNLPYKISQAGATLYRVGVSYHAYGVTKQGKTALFDFFQCDAVTPKQLDAIKTFCPDVQIVGVHGRYAPELKRVHVLFPKAAWYRLNKGA